MNRVNVRAALMVAIALLCGMRSAAAQAPYPSNDIHIIVGYSPGSGPDTLARFFAEAIRKGSGRNVVVENRPGALTNIAAQAVARAKPDGYTVFMTSGNSTMSSNQWLFKELPYDPVKDFTPVTSLTSAPFAFAVPLGSPLELLQDLTDALRAKGARGKYAYANSISLAASELYKSKTGLDFVGVSYKSIADSHAALAAGEVDFSIADLTIQNRSKFLALTTAERTFLAPQIPSAKEAGLEGFDLGSWWAVWLPKGAPADVVDKLISWIEPSVASDAARDFLTPVGIGPWPGVRKEALTKYQEVETAKWKEAIQLSKIEPQ